MSDDLAEVATCQLNAMVHEHRNILMARVIGRIRQGVRYADEHPEDPEVVRTRALRILLTEILELEYGTERYKQAHEELDELHKQERAIMFERMKRTMNTFLDRLDADPSMK